MKAKESRLEVVLESLQKLLRNCRSWILQNGYSADVTDVDALILKNFWYLPYVRRISMREFPEVSVKDFNDVKFDERFLLLSCQLRRDFRFINGIEMKNSADRSFRDCFELQS